MCWSNERQDAESDLFAAGLAEEHFEADLSLHVCYLTRLMQLVVLSEANKQPLQ